MTAATIEATEVQANSNARLDAASKIISEATKWSAVASIIPVPSLDLVAIGAVQVKLVTDIAKLYGSDFTHESIKALVSALLGTLIPSGASKALVGSAAKSIPGYGTVIGFVSLAAFSSAATYAIGKIFVRHFENGGTLADFSPEAVKADLKNEFQKAAN